MWSTERQVRYHNIYLVSLMIIRQASFGPPLIPGRGDSESTLFCSECISDNDFGRSYYAVGCGQVATRDTIYANPPPIPATTTSSVSAQQSSSSTTPPTGSHSNDTSTSDTSPIVSIITPPPNTSAVAPKSTSVPLGPIIGGAVGGVIVICLTALAIFLILHRKRRAHSVRSSSPLRRSSSCKKHEICEESPEAYGIFSQSTHDKPKIAREPVELE